MFIPDPDFFPSRIPTPDLGVGKAVDPGSATHLHANEAARDKLRKQPEENFPPSHVKMG
jgi:hypothetical protein